MIGPRFGTLSLRTSILLSVIVPTAIAIAGAGYAGLRMVEGWVESRMQEEVQTIARSIHLPVSRSMERDRQGTVAQTLEAAFRLSQVYSVYVYGLDGEELVAVGVPDEQEPERMTGLALRGDRTDEYGRIAGREVYSYFVPLMDSGRQPLGLLQVTRRRSDFAEEVGRLRLRAGGLLILGLGVVIPLVLVGHRRTVGRHLGRLERTMDRIGGGEQEERATVEGPREIARLATHLNTMLGRMDEAGREIARSRDAQLVLERRLRRSEKLAAIGRLAAGVAHELGSPLSVVDGLAVRTLRREALDAPTRDDIREIRGEVARMEHIVGQLLEFGRGDGGDGRRRVGVDRLAAGAASTVRGMLDRVGVTLEMVGGPSSPDVEVQPAGLERALANLLRNGAQAASNDAKDGGRLRLTWEVDGSEVALIVDDDGPGIPDEIRGRIFEPFFTTKSLGEGTGLGLAVVHGIAEAEGGRVEVRESPLGGARFVIRLPLAESA
ncbi:MAG: sensor histidine kinase [Gemmatimonadota bacterium]